MRKSEIYVSWLTVKVFAHRGAWFWRDVVFYCDFGF